MRGTESPSHLSRSEFPLLRLPVRPPAARGCGPTSLGIAKSPFKGSSAETRKLQDPSHFHASHPAQPSPSALFKDTNSDPWDSQLCRIDMGLNPLPSPTRLQLQLWTNGQVSAAWSLQPLGGWAGETSASPFTGPLGHARLVDTLPPVS